ncbi:retrovirus-related Pol polyprotein from transposon TNT 1-94 [Trichonephila clavipes]|nr:retrovirus-related Pol polyprotein from transposon TNT 1-94 [Trichonephila clavipes]
MVGTRPDLAYSVGFLSRSLENPSVEDIVKVKRVFRYIAGTVGYGITYHATETKGVLHCYSDSDFGGCTKTSQSISGYVMIYAGGAISWRSQRQAIVATSTTEAEVIAASEAAKEVIWLCRLIQGIVNLREIPTLQVDNRAAVKLSHNPEYHRRTKHIEIKHFVREKVLEGN